MMVFNKVNRISDKNKILCIKIKVNLINQYIDDNKLLMKNNCPKLMGLCIWIAFYIKKVELKGN